MADLLLSSAEYVLGLCTDVYKMARTAKSNKVLCRQVGERVSALEKMVLSIKRRPETASPDVRDALVDLARSLTDAAEFMGKVSKANTLLSFLNSSKNESKFQEVSQKLNEDVQLLSVALQISHGDALRDGLKTVVAQRKAAEAGRRRRPALPQVAAFRAADAGWDPDPDPDPDPALPDSTSLVAKLLLATMTKAPTPRTSTILVGASPKTDVPAQRSSKASSGVAPPATAPTPAPVPMPVSPFPVSPFPVSPFPVSPFPMSPFPVFTYPVAPPPPLMVLHPAPVLYQPPARSVTSTVISYNRTPSRAALSLAQRHASVPPHLSFVNSNTVTKTYLI